MSSGLELADSRVSRIALVDGTAYVHFSHAYIKKSYRKHGKEGGTAWSQEAVLVMEDATFLNPLPLAPATITEGYLEVGGIRHEIIPLPFKRKVRTKLLLIFTDGAQAGIVGNRSHIELLGKQIYLEDI